MLPVVDGTFPFDRLPLFRMPQSFPPVKESREKIFAQWSNGVDCYLRGGTPKPFLETPINYSREIDYSTIDRISLDPFGILRHEIVPFQKPEKHQNGIVSCAVENVILGPVPLDYMRAIIFKLSNFYRRVHNVAEFKYCCKLEKSAEIYAWQLYETGQFQHSTTLFGENLYKRAASDGFFKFLDPVTVVRNWYTEIDDYQGDFTEYVGHFTQLVWKDSKEMGVGIASGDRGTILVVHYNPPGNVLGQFREKVLAPEHSTRPIDGIFAMKKC